MTYLSKEQRHLVTFFEVPYQVILYLLKELRKKKKVIWKT